MQAQPVGKKAGVAPAAPNGGKEGGEGHRGQKRGNSAVGNIQAGKKQKTELDKAVEAFWKIKIAFIKARTIEEALYIDIENNEALVASFKNNEMILSPSQNAHQDIMAVLNSNFRRAVWSAATSAKVNTYAVQTPTGFLASMETFEQALTPKIAQYEKKVKALEREVKLELELAQE